MSLEHMNGADMIFTAAYDDTKPLKLSISNTSGDITVEPSDVTQIEIDATRISGHTEDEDNDFVFETKDNTITLRPNWHIGARVSDLAAMVKSQLKEGFRAEEWDPKKFKSGGDATYDLSVRVPRHLPADSTVALKTASGDVTISELTANLSVASASGDQRISDITGKVSAHTANGDIAITNVNGSVESNTAQGDVKVTGGEGWTAIRCVNGDIAVRDFTLKNAKITTVSGDVLLEATLNNQADYSIDSVNGDVRLITIVPTAGASLRYKALSGSAKAAGDWTRGEGKNVWTIGDGEIGPRLSVKTVNGDLYAEASADASIEGTFEALPEDIEADQSSDDSKATAEGTTYSYSSEDKKTVNDDKDKQEVNVNLDVELEKARGWLKDMGTKLSAFVATLDEAGDKRWEERRARKVQESSTTRDESEPIEADAVTISTEEDIIPTEPFVAETDTAEDVTTEFEAIAGEESAPTFAEAAAEGLEEAPEEVAAPTEPIAPTAERRIRLLEAVQRGELTVDEALRQLDEDPTTL